MKWAPIEIFNCFLFLTEKALELTESARGKHHLSDFLPPDELEKFLEKVKAVKEGREADFSDYAKYKINEENVGYQMLMKAGWQEGSGLGSKGEGITAPINKLVLSLLLQRLLLS